MQILSAFIENPKEYIYFSDREPGEKLMFLLRRHPITNLGWIFTTLVLLALPTALNYIVNASDLALPVEFGLVTNFVFYLFAAIFAFESFLTWFYNVFIITDRRIVDINFYGFFYKRVTEAPWQNIEDTTYIQSGVLQTIFNFGDVFVQTAAEQREFGFESVPQPRKVYDIITDLVAANQKND